MKKLHFRVIICAGVLVLAGLVVFLVNGKNTPPPGFLAAREKAAFTGQIIVDLTQKTYERIQQVRLSDINGASAETLALIKEARDSNTEAYKKAFELSQYLEQMARSLDEVHPREAQQLAYQAVAVEFALVSDFIAYTKNLNDFFDALSVAVVSGLPTDRQRAGDFLSETNKRVATINSLNQDFGRMMSEFDDIFR